MKTVTIYHNPRCSKSRQALQLLHDKGIDPLIIEYLKIPLKQQEIVHLLSLLSLSPQELIRKNEPLYKTLNLNRTTVTDKELIKAMVENPLLIERPIIVSGRKALIARPPEKLLEII